MLRLLPLRARHSSRIAAFRYRRRLAEAQDETARALLHMKNLQTAATSRLPTRKSRVKGRATPE